jgi:hypothetical protein
MEGTVAGWGKTDNSFGKTGTNILNKVQVPIIDNRKCKRWHKEKVNGSAGINVARYFGRRLFGEK